MIVLKWLVVLVSIGYLGGLAVLFFVQRSFLFPIPQTGRTAPQAAGFPRSRRTCSDNGGWRESHRLARPGEARPSRSSSIFTGNGDFLAGARRPLSRYDLGRDRPRCAVLSRLCRLERPAERAGSAAGRRCSLCLHDGAVWRGPNRGLGLFARQRGRSGAGGGPAGREADPGGSLYLDRGRRGLAVSNRAGTLADAGIRFDPTSVSGG